MIEQQIEQRILSKISSALSAEGIADVRLVGQLTAAAGVKGLENAEDSVIVIAKSSPRSYATPMIPTATINVDVSILVRADVDYSGKSYLDVSNLLMGIFQRWQRCLDDTHDDLTIEGEWDCTGYQLAGGSFALDQSGKVWQYSHSMTIYGVVLDGIF